MLNITVERVSMPSRAGTPFLQNAWVVEMIEDGRSINALSGWYSISTVPLQKPRFMRFLEPVFAGIYQNILTMTIFRAC